MSRYTPPPTPDFGHSYAFGSAPEPIKKKDPLEDFLRFGASVAPTVGTVAGGIIGGVAGGGIPGAMLGAGLGNAAGQAVGGLAGYGADQMAAPEEEAAMRRMRDEQERAARSQAVLSLLR